MYRLPTGTTDRTITVYIPDPASTDGSGKTGLTHSDLTVSYTRAETDNDVAVTDVTSSLSTLSALTDAHTDWGVKEVSSTLAPGLYRLDIADAVLASGATEAVVYVMITSSAAAASPVKILLESVPANIKQVNDDAFDAGLAQFGCNVIQISGDATAANNLEAILDGTGGVTLVASAFTLTTPITANVTQLSGDSTAADNAESFFDGTGYAGTNNVIPTVTTLTNLPAITTNWLTAAGLATDAVNEIADGILGRDASASTTNSTLGAIINDWENGGRLDLIIDDILVDTAAIDAIASKLSGLVMASEVIGSTGNSTTAIHMPTLTYGNDEINDHLLVIYDNSTGEFHSRWVTAWSNASKLATVATLPFTPENAVDTYYLTSIRRDMTASTVSDKTGYALSSTGLDSVTLPANLITSSSLAASAAQEIADQVWEEAIADHSGTAGSTAEALNAAGAAGDPWTTALPGAYGAGSAGYIIGTNINATISSRSSHTAANVRTEMDSNSTQLAAIVADTNELQTDWANGGRLDLLLDATLADTNELQTDWVNGGRLDLLLDATLADTNELQTDWANGGRLDLIVDAILVDTAEIGAAGAGLTEAGGTGDQFTAIPWNAAWDTEVQSECTDALNAYDPPTKAETDALLTTAMTEAYPTDGSTMTVAQALYLILANVSEFAISGTTLTAKKLDGSTTAATYTLDDATNPTSRTRAS